VNRDPEGGLVAPSDIAELAGVSRAAVSNWRKRHDDFPKPVGGTVAQPLFSRTDVEDWLMTHGRTRQRPAADGLQVLAVVNRFRDEVSAGKARSLVLALLCARNLADGTDTNVLRQAAGQGRLLQELDIVAKRRGGHWPELVTAGLHGPTHPDSHRTDTRATERLAEALFDVIFDIAVEDLEAVSDLVLERAAGNEGRLGAVHGAVGTRLAKLLAQAGATASETVYDPACGIGEALLKSWQRNPNRARLRLVGADVDGEYVRICRQRCFLYGAKATIEQADVLQEDPHPGLYADVVIAEPPFGDKMPRGFSVTDPRWALAGPPPPNNSETAWLQHAITHLAPSGRGFVLTSATTTVATSAARIRRALVEQGCVEAVVALPRRFLTHTAVPTALWVLREPHPTSWSGTVTLLDASGLDPRREKNFPLLDWLTSADSRLDAGLRRRSIPIGEILSDDRVNLDARYWNQSTVDPGELAERYHRAAATLSQAFAALHHQKSLTVQQFPTGGHPVSVRELERIGVLSILRTPTKRGRDGDAAPGEDPRVVTSQMIIDGLPEPPNLPSLRTSAVDNFADDDPRAIDDGVTHPGDILVVTRPTVTAVVDETGGRMPGPGVIRLRPDQRIDPHYVAECLRGSWNRQVETSADTPAGGIRKLEIPLIPLGDQERLVAAVVQARRLAAAGRRITAAADELAAVRLDAIRFGVDLTEDR
jgi:hypothetical protein